jgi:predicted nuclease of predicted toxin-antitoxin system
LRFLVDADLSPRLAAIFTEYGHDSIHVYDEALGTAPDPQIAALARRTSRCIVTADFDFANVLDYPPRHYRGIVVLTLPYGIGPSYIDAIVRYFLGRLPELPSLDGKLVIVELGRIRVRE